MTYFGTCGLRRESKGWMVGCVLWGGCERGALGRWAKDGGAPPRSWKGGGGVEVSVVGDVWRGWLCAGGGKRGIWEAGRRAADASRERVWGPWAKN